VLDSVRVSVTAREHAQLRRDACFYTEQHAVPVSNEGSRPRFFIAFEISYNQVIPVRKPGEHPWPVIINCA